MISFLRWVAKRKNQTEAKWDRLKGLINKQKNKYLNGLVLYTESEDYQEQRRQVFEWLKKFHFLEAIYDKINTKYIVPIFNDGRDITLQVKDRQVYEVLTYLDATKLMLKEKYMTKATIKPIF
jgi:DNA integrity scanning protein DisA with diadenylate cyclase activity